MKKAVISLMAVAGLVFMPFSSTAHAATSTFTATVTTPNVPATVITIPDLTGGGDGASETQATSTVTVSGTTGSVTSLNATEGNLIASEVTFGADASANATLLANAINANSSVTSYSAVSSGDTVTITAPAGTGTDPNGTGLTYTTSAGSDIVLTTTPFSGGVGAVTNATASTTSSSFSAVRTAAGTDLGLNIASTSITLTLGEPAADAAQTAVDAINANSSSPYIATRVGDTINLRAKVSGSAGNGPVVASDLSYNGIAKVVTFTPANITAGETFRITITGTNYDYTAKTGDTVASVTAALAAKVNADPSVSCTSDGTAITCTATDPGVNFDASATVLDIGVSGGSTGSTTPILNPVTISSSNANSSCAKVGDVVTLHFTSDELLGASTTVDILGTPVTITSLGGNMYAASTTLSASSTSGLVTFLISPYTSGNVAASTTASTTDSSSVHFLNGLPVITLNGNSTANLLTGATYSDQGASSTDALGGSLTASTTGSVDVHTPGTYTLTYTASDCAGNTASTTRTVLVQAQSSGGGSSSVPGSQSGSSGGTTYGGIVVATATLLPPITIGGPVVIPLIPNTGVEAFFTTDLAEGMSGAEVLMLQEKLATLGYYAGPMTGYFGPLTHAAVVRFQLSQGIPGTGFVGPLTISALNQM